MPEPCVASTTWPTCRLSVAPSYLLLDPGNSQAEPRLRRLPSSTQGVWRIELIEAGAGLLAIKSMSRCRLLPTGPSSSPDCTMSGEPAIRERAILQ